VGPEPKIPWSQRIRAPAAGYVVRPGQRLRHRVWALVPVGVVVTLAIGIPALLAWPESGVQNISGALYATLRMFTLDGPLGGPLPFAVELARFLAAAVTVSAALAAVLSLLGPHLLRWRVRRWSGHVVVAGLGPEGRRLAEGFLAQGRRVVAIDIPGADGHGAGLRDHGVLVLTGDPRDPAMLAAANVARADVVLATAPEDAVNAEVAVQTLRAHEQAVRAGRDAGLRCFAHVGEPALRACLSRHAALGRPADRFELRLFSLAANAARLLVVDGLAHGLASRRGLEAPAHLVVVGLREVGEAVVLEAARLPRRPEPRALRVTALDTDAPLRLAALLRRLPGLDALCALTAHTTDLDPAAVAAGVAAAERDDPVSAVVVALPDRGASVAIALEVRAWCAQRGIPVFVRLREERGLAELLGEGAGTVQVFGTADSAGSKDVVVEEALDVLARAIHAEYVEKQRARGVTPAENPSLVTWDALPETLREANRCQADHVPVKLGAVGCDVAPAHEDAGAPVVFTPAEVEALAVLEHARWAADRVLEGWTYAAGPKDAARRTSPHLVPWASLSEEVRNADREPVLAIPRHLARLRLRIVRSAPGSLRG